MAENPCWDGYEQIGMKMKNGKKVPNCVPVKRAKKLSTIDEQTQKIKEAALALVAQANAEFSGTRTITHKAAITVVERSIAKNTEEPFSVRKHRALTDLSHYITLAQHNRAMSATPENTDLLPIAHPRSTRAHDMTTASLMQYRARWVTDDPAIKNPTVKTLLASALTSHPASAEYEYAVARLSSFPEGHIPKYALLAALGDGNSSAARRARAMRQRRDRKGRFAEMGGGLRALIRRLNGMVQNLNGRAVSQGIDGDTFDMETPDGKLYRVPAQNVEAIKAIIPSQQTKDGYAKNPAKVSAKDPVIDEADLVEIEAPEGFRRDDAWSPKKEDQDYYGEKVDLGVKYTDDAYDVIKMENNQAAKDKFEMADQREREGQNVVAQGEGKNGALDPNKPVYIVGRRGQEDDRPFAVVQSWAEVQDFIAQDEPRFEKNENPNPARMGGGDDDGTPPEAPAKPADDKGDDRFPEGTEFIPGTKNPSRAEMREYRRNLKNFRKNGGLLPLDPRKNWAMLPDGSVVDADSGEVLRNNKKEVFLPKEEEKKGLGARIKEALAPKGAYEVDRGDYKPEGPVDGQESDDFTDDPAELAQKFSKEELQDSLKDAVEGTPEQPAPGVGQLPFEAGDENVPAEALYNALKEQGVDIDKFLNDIYNQLAGKKKQEVAPVDQETKDAQGVDVPEAPAAQEPKAELPPVIEGMTPEEQRDYIDNGDYKKYLKPNEEMDVPEGYVALDNEPFNEELVQVPADAPEGFNMNPVDIALGYNKEDLKNELRRAVEPGNNMPGHGILGQETPEGEFYQAFVPGEAIRDALQLQGEDTNALLNDIYAEGKDNQPTDQEVADALEGENVQEAPAEPEKSPAQDAQGPDAAEPEAGLPANPEADGPEAGAEGAEGTAGVGSQEADLAIGEPRREMVAAKDLQPGDIAVRDNEYFVIEEVAQPDAATADQNNKKINRIKVKGYYPGHQTQERDWFANGKIEVLRGVAVPAKGDGEQLNKPQLADYGKMKKVDGEWGLADPAAQAKYDADMAAHKAAVQAAGADFVDPTKNKDVIDAAAVAEPMPQAGPVIAKLKAGDLEIGDITTKDHFRIVDIKPGEGGKLLITGHYPGQGLQEKQWYPNTRIEVYRGIAEADAPQLGEGSLHRPAGRGPKGGWFPVEDTALNAEHEAKLAEAKARWNPPADVPVVASGDLKGENKLEEAVKPPRAPREPAYPAFMGKFAEWAKEAQGKWAAFKDKLKGQELIVFDFETTGVDVNDGNEPWQIAGVKMVDGKIVDRINIFMNPGKSIKGTYAGDNAKDPDGNPLTDEFFADKPTQAEGLQQFLDWAGANPLAIAQNAKFDDEIMRRKAAELGLNWEPAGIADTMGMAEQIFKDAPDAPGRKSLAAIAEYFGIDNANWHDGANDAEVTAQAFMALIDKGAEGDFGVAALDADAQQAAYDAKMAEIQPKIDEFKKAAADYLAQKALREGLAGKPVNLDEIKKDITAPVVQGPIDNVGAMDNPEQPEKAQPDLVDVNVDSAFPDGKMRIAEPEFAENPENVDALFRGEIKVNDLRPGDFVHAKKDQPGFWQIVSIRGGEEFGVEEFKRRIVVQNADGEQRVMFWNQNAFLDEVRRPKNRAELAGEPMPEKPRTPEEMNMQAVTVANGNAFLGIEQDGDEFVAKGRILDANGEVVYSFEGRYLTPEGAEAEGKALLRRAGVDLADLARRNDGKPESKEKSVAVGVEPANVDQLPVIEVVDDLPIGEGENEITPRVEGDAVVFKSDARVIDEGEVVAQVVQDFPSRKEASQGGRDAIDAAAQALAEQIAEMRADLLLRTEGRGRKNLPPIPEKYRRQVYIRLLAGLYADADGNPLAIGDKVIHENPKMAAKFGEGVVVGKVQGKIGGLQRKGVVYVDYVRVKYPNGEIRKYVSRFQRHIDPVVAKERFDAEPRINWMNAEEMGMALEERRKKPRKGGNEAVDAADVAVDEVVEEVKAATGGEAPAVAEPEAAPAPEPEVAPEPEAPAAGGDAFDRLEDGQEVAAQLEEMAAKLPKFRNNRAERNARWARRRIDEAAEAFRARPLDKAADWEIRDGIRYANRIPDEALKAQILPELERLRDNLDAKREEIKQARIAKLNEKYNKPIPDMPTDVNKENLVAALDAIEALLPDSGESDIDWNGARARDYLDRFKREANAAADDRFDRIDRDYLGRAAQYLENGDVNADAQKAIAGKLRELKGLVDAKAEADRKVAQEKALERLREEFGPDVFPAEEDLNKENVMKALDEVIRRLPERDDRAADENLRRAGVRLAEYRDRLAGKELDTADMYALDRAIVRLRNVGEDVPNAIADRLEGLKVGIEANKEKIKEARREEMRRVLNEPLDQNLVPNVDNVNKDAIRALVDDINRRLPNDYDDAFDEKGWRAKQYLDKYLEDLNAVDDGLIADRSNLDDAIRNLRAGKEAAFGPLADALENMSQGISEAVIRRPVGKFAGINLEEVDPIEVAEQRIANGENKFQGSTELNAEMNDAKVYDDNAYMKPFEDELRAFFNGSANPLAQLSPRARQALAQYLGQEVRKGSRSGDAGKARAREMVNLAMQVKAERDVYQPNRENVGDAGAFLLQVDPEAVFSAGKSIGRVGGRKQIQVNGQDTGYTVVKISTGINETYMVEHDASGQRFFFKREGSSSTANAEYYASQVARALGITGRPVVERNVNSERVLVITAAGDTLRAGGPVQVMGNSPLGLSDAADRAGFIDIANLGILDAVVLNSDRHTGNFMAVKIDTMGVQGNGVENYQLIPIDHGFANALNGGKYGNETQAPWSYIKAGEGRHGGQIVRNLMNKMGGTAYKELVDMSIQQAIQYLQRVHGPDVQDAQIANMIARLESLKGVDVSKWISYIGKE